MRKCIVLSNDIVPGMGMPVAAPGLRAHGIAEGLRAHGIDVTLVVPRNIVRRQWWKRAPGLPEPSSPGTVTLSPSQIKRFLNRHLPLLS